MTEYNAEALYQSLLLNAQPVAPVGNNPSFVLALVPSKVVTMLGREEPKSGSHLQNITFLYRKNPA